MKTFIKNVYFFYIFLCTVLSCPLFAISSNNPYKVLAFLPAILSIIVGFICGIKLIDRTLGGIFFIIISSSVALHFVHGVSYSPYLLLSVYVGYVCFHLFKDDIVDRFVNISYKLTVIGLFLWVATMISHSAMLSLADTIGYDGFGVSKSLYIYNVDNLNDYSDLAWATSGILTNCGYCWENGRYSCFLLLTIYFYVIKKGMSFKDKKLLVLIFALITTQSTTGYMVFLMFLIYWYMRGRKFKVWYLVPLVTLVTVVWTLPFIQDKILALLVDPDDMDNTISNWQWMSNNKDEGYIVPQRFTGFWLQLMNLQNSNLLIGDSSNITNHYIVNDLGINAAISEGILGIIVRYGLILGSMAYYMLFRSSYCIAQKYGLTQTFLLAAIFIGINFSYNFWEDPLLISFWMWAAFAGKLSLSLKNNTITTRI